MSWCGPHWVYLLWDCLFFQDLDVCFLPHTGAVLGHHFFKYLLYPFVCLFLMNPCNANVSALTWCCPPGPLPVVPSVFGPWDRFCRRVFSRTGEERWFQDDSSTLHLLYTFFFLLLHQLHLTLSDIRSQSFETPALNFLIFLSSLSFFLFSMCGFHFCVFQITSLFFCII